MTLKSVDTLNCCVEMSHGDLFLLAGTLCEADLNDLVQGSLTANEVYGSESFTALDAKTASMSLAITVLKQLVLARSIIKDWMNGKGQQPQGEAECPVHGNNSKPQVN